VHYWYRNGVITPEKLAVLSVSFVEHELGYSELLSYLVDRDKRSIILDKEVNINDFNDFFEPLREFNFWAYEGSTTTPGCSEIVQWIVI
jgi:carbonic anhydrase